MARSAVALTAALAGGLGAMVGGMGLLDSCLPGTWADSPGWTCYSPPWAWPALVLGAAVVSVALIALAVVGVAHLRDAARPPRRVR